MSTTEEAALVHAEVSGRGKQVYEEQLKSCLEPEHNGRFVAVEPQSGRYFLGDTDTEALVAAHEATPESHFYVKRIGYDFTHRIGGRALTWWQERSRTGIPTK